MKTTIKVNVKTTTFHALIQFKDGHTETGEDTMLGKASLAAMTKQIKSQLENVRSVIITDYDTVTEKREIEFDVFMRNSKPCADNSAEDPTA